MSYEKLLKKLKKYIKKEWKIKKLEISLDDRIIDIAEKIAMIDEGCTKEEVYKKWILKPNLYLPGWISFFISSQFTDSTEINQNSTIREMFDKRR